MKDVVVGWALAKLSGAAGKNKLESAALDQLVKRFGIDSLGRELLALAWAHEKSLEVARTGELTVGLARHALGQSLDAILSAGGSLRRHALIQLDVAGPATAKSELRLGIGLGARLDGAPLELDGFAPGVRLLRGDSWLEQVPAHAKVAELVKEKIATTEALLVTVDGCPRRDALSLAVAAGKRFSRAVLAIDGELIANFAGRWELLSALRREADLEGLVLLVTQAAALGEAWRALTASPIAQPNRMPLLVLADSERTREVTLVEGLRHLPLGLSLPPIVAEKPVEKAAEAPPPPPKEEDPYEAIRKQAQRDAERALGIYRPPPQPVRIPPPGQPIRVEPGPKPTAGPDSLRSPPQVEAAKPVEAPKVEAPKVEPPKVETPKVEAPKVEAAAEEKPKKARRSKKAIEHFGPDPEDEAPPAKAQAAPAKAEPAKAEPPQAEPPKAEAPDTGGLSLSEPYLPISEKPTPDELAMIARTSKNPQQRLELLTELKGLKIPSVVQAMRENTKASDPAVRALAEATMASFFGANWNVSRAVPKPVQPPPSPDKNPNRPW